MYIFCIWLFSLLTFFRQVTFLLRQSVYCEREKYILFDLRKQILLIFLQISMHFDEYFADIYYIKMTDITSNYAGSDEILK